MGHPNFKHILGQVICLPLPVGGKYEDNFIIAHPITSLFDLSTDEYFEEFLNAKNMDIYLSSGVKTRVIDLCYYDDQFYFEPLPALDRYYQTASVLSGIGISWSHNNDYRAYKNSQNLQKYDIDIPQIFIQSSQGDGWFSPYCYLEGYKPGEGNSQIGVTPSVTPTGISVVGLGERYIGFNIQPRYNEDYGFVSGLNLRYYNTEDTSYKVFPPNYPTTINPNVVVADDYIFVNTETRLPLDHYIYNNYNSDEEKKNNPIYEKCFTVPSIGVNMMVITCVKKNEFKEEDIEYISGQVGEVFHSVLCAEYVLGCPSLEIHPLSLCHLGNSKITKQNYPEFFAMYGCESDEPIYPSEVIFGIGHTPNNRTSLPNLRSLRQVVGGEKPADVFDQDGVYYLDEDLMLYGDREVKSSVFLLDKFFPPKEVKPGETLVRTLRPVDKDKKRSESATSVGGLSTFATSFSPGGINPQDMKVFPYVIVRSKL